LQLLHALDVFLQLVLGFIDGVPMRGIRGINVFQSEMFSIVNAVRFHQFGRFHRRSLKSLP